MPVSLRSIMSAERLSEGKFALRRSKRFWRVNWTIKGERIWHLGQTGFNRLLKELRKVERCWWWDVWPAAEFKNWFSMSRKCVRLIVVTQYEYASLSASLSHVYIFKYNSKTANTVFSIYCHFKIIITAILHIRHMQKQSQYAAYNQPDHIIIHRYLYAKCGSSKHTLLFWINTDAYDLRQFL